MWRHALILALLALIAAAAAAPAQAVQPGRNGMLATRFDDNEDNGSATGGHPYPIRHGYLALPRGTGPARPVAWCQHRYMDPSPCRRFGAIEFSPDGKQLADAQPLGLWVRAVDGTDPKQLSPLYAVSPSWSPDGKRIAFVSGGDVFTIGADGLRLRRVTRTESSFGDPGSVRSVSWSSRGKLAMAIAERPRGRIVTAAADGRGAKTILRAPSDAATVDWAPDGRRVLVSSGARVLLADASGHRRSRLVARLAFGARMSPDGRRIAYFRYPSGGSTALFVARSDGSREREVSLAENETGRGDREFSRELGPLTWQALP